MDVELILSKLLWVGDEKKVWEICGTSCYIYISVIVIQLLRNVKSMYIKLNFNYKSSSKQNE